MQPLYPPGSADPRSMLIILPTWVGDFVMATPALRAIRERFPQTRIVFLMEANLLDLARGGDWMDETLAWPLRRKRTVRSREYRALVRRLREESFDCAVLLSNSFRSGLIARLAGARRRIGYSRDARGWLLSDPLPVPNKAGTWIAREKFSSLATTTPTVVGPSLPRRLGRFVPMPLVEYFAELAERLGCKRPGDRLQLFTTPDRERSLEARLGQHGGLPRPWIVLSPGAKFGASKCWPTERFAEAADRLIRLRGASILITCGPGEEPIAGAIKNVMKQPSCLLVEPLLSLGELKSLIRRCDLLIANDAGPRHIAKAFDVPVVTVFGPTHPDWTATNYPNERIVRVDVQCGPCQQPICPLKHHECMKAVTVDMVLAAADELLSRVSPPAPAVR